MHSINGALYGYLLVTTDLSVEAGSPQSFTTLLSSEMPPSRYPSACLPTRRATIYTCTFLHFHHSVIYRPRHLPDSLTQRFICRNKYDLASQIHSPGRTEGRKDGRMQYHPPSQPHFQQPPSSSQHLPLPPSPPRSLTPPGRLNITPLPVIKQPIFFPSHPLFSSKTDRNFLGGGAIGNE